MDTKRDTRDMGEADRLSLVALIEAELALDPDTDNILWDLLDTPASRSSHMVLDEAA